MFSVCQRLYFLHKMSFPDILNEFRFCLHSLVTIILYFLLAPQILIVLYSDFFMISYSKKVQSAPSCISFVFRQGNRGRGDFQRIFFESRLSPNNLPFQKPQSASGEFLSLPNSQQQPSPVLPSEPHRGGERKGQRAGLAGPEPPPHPPCSEGLTPHFQTVLSTPRLSCCPVVLGSVNSRHGQEEGDWSTAMPP